MLAEILAIGSELLGFTRLDTNSLFLTRELLALGIGVQRKTVLPDDAQALTDAIRAALARSDVVLCTGGLGPTEDDRTVSAAAAALEVALVPDAAATRRLRQWFRRRHRPFRDMQLRQARRLASAVWLPNSLGTAAGQWSEKSGKILVLLPGPPPELEAMFLASVRPRLKARAPAVARAVRVLSIAGLGEGEVDALAAPIYRQTHNPVTTILATAAPQVELHFLATGTTRAVAQARADRLAHRIERKLGLAVFSREQQTLAEVLGDLLRERRQTLALAESCTGGMLAERLTAAAGASDFFLGGVVSYANRAKQDLLGVCPATLARYGAVSAATAREMAGGACERFASDWSLAITGIAGPGGGSVRKPVGTVFIAVGRRGKGAQAFAYRFYGDRDRIRRFSAQTALNRLRLALLAIKNAGDR